MRFATANQISLPDLQAMVEGTLENTINDMDFLQTLAAQKCLIVPPAIMQTSFDGTLVQVTPLIYTLDGDLDKPRMLLALARFLHEKQSSPFARRFNF